LLPGFVTNLGAIFEAFIEGCANTFGGGDTDTTDEELQNEATESNDKN